MKILSTVLFLSAALAAGAATPFVYVPFAGTNHHTGFEAWPAFDGEGYHLGMTNLEWPAWEGWRMADTNFHLIEGRLCTVESEMGTLSDTQTNAMLNSFRKVAYSTNGWGVPLGVTNVFATVTNYAGASYQSWFAYYDTNGVQQWAGGQQFGYPLFYSLNGGPWQADAESLVTTGVVQLSFQIGAGSSGGALAYIPPAAVSNMVLYSMVRPDLFGRTNIGWGQKVKVGTPVDADDAVPLSLLQSTFSTYTASAASQVQLNGQMLNLSAVWQQNGTANTTNADAFHLSYLDVDALTVTQPLPSFVGISKITASARTNLQLTIPTNGLNQAPAIQMTHYLAPPNWGWLTSSNWVSGTNYVVQVAMGFPDTTFYRAAIPSPLPGIATLSAVLQCPTFTVTNTTDSTYGFGAGLARWDTNYIYISVSTNHWKRASLSTW